MNPPPRAEVPEPAAAPAPEAVPPRIAGELLASDTPKATVSGNTFIAPAGWTLTVRGPATILTAPEGDSHIALVDVQGESADDAVAKAWAAYKPEMKWPLKVATEASDREGWTRIRNYQYETAPNERRVVAVIARFANDMWTVSIYDMASAVGETRLSQVASILGRLQPKGYERESFAGKRAHKLDKARIAEIAKFIETSQKQLGVPGVSLGLVQDGKVVFAGGFGVRELGKPAKVDADTKYLIASLTKALTTLMLAKLVDEKKLTWDTTAISLLPSFKLGDADTTARVRVKHLICACTGMPRQDLEWFMEFKEQTAEGVLKTLGMMQPTSEFGALYQYSNQMAAAGGFIGGHVAFPGLELGKAYDEAMRTRVFGPLAMKDTTFDFKRAQRGNFAAPHSQDIDGQPALAAMAVNYAAIPVRPSAGAWSNVRDILRYVQMELADGKLPGGRRLVSKESLLTRREPQVGIGKDGAYGMGLGVDIRNGVRVVHHNGSMPGYRSEMMWLPEHGVGAVVLTNGNAGQFICAHFRRKLLEVLFGGKREADAQIAAEGKTYFASMAAERKLLTVPADAREVEKLAPRYVNDALGEVRVIREGVRTIVDVGEWKTEVATKRNPDGTVSLVPITPGIRRTPVVVGSGAKRTLVVRDAQHEYVFDEH